MFMTGEQRIRELKLNLNTCITDKYRYFKIQLGTW